MTLQSKEISGSQAAAFLPPTAQQGHPPTVSRPNERGRNLLTPGPRRVRIGGQLDRSADRLSTLNRSMRATRTLTDQTIQNRVLKVIATSKRIPVETVQPDSSFESLEMDSLDRLNILFDLENEFDIEINDEEAKQVKNIQEMIDGVTQLVQAKKSASPTD
jgi:acyl carrier protein